MLDQNKKGQIGETITWVVATIVIVLVLGISIFLSSIYVDKFKKIQSQNLQGADLFAAKSFFSYLLTQDSDDKDIYSQFQEEENLNDFNGNLAVNIFEQFHRDNYLDLWVGMVFNKTIEPYRPNDYFGTVPTTVSTGYLYDPGAPLTGQKIYLTENKSIEMILKIDDD